MNKSCFHCEEIIPDNTNITLTVNGKNEALCCLGCKAVAETILLGGFEQYYQFRSNKAPQAAVTHQDKYTRYNEDSIQAEFVEQHNSNLTADLAIEGIHCAACAWLIEQRLAVIKGVKQVSVNSTSHRAKVTWVKDELPLSEIFSAIDEIGYQGFPFKINEQESRFKATHKSFLKRVAVSGLMTMQVMMLAFAMYSGVIEAQYEHFFRWISLILTLPVITYSAYPIIRSAIRAMGNKTVNMDVPVTLAITGTFIASVIATLKQNGEVYFESVSMFTFLLLLGRFLEHNVRSTAATVTANMLKLLPLYAHKKSVDSHGDKFTEVSARQLIKDDIIQVREGMTLPADGILLSPYCYIDESMLTGESEPVLKQQNDLVFAGTILYDQTVEISVTAAGNTTSLYQIANSESTLASQSNFVSMADTLSKYFVTAVLIISALTFCSWYYFTDENPFWPMIAVLVATCPCALSLAMPTAMVAATTKLKKQGILVNRTEALEAINTLSTLAFDKTGTLTEGKLSLESIVNFSSINDEELLAIIAAIESYSSHPIASAFKPIEFKCSVSNVNIDAGLGISGQIQNQTYYIGNQNYIKHSVPENHLEARLFIANDECLLAAIYLTDPLREDAKPLIKSLPVKSTILSGDNDLIVQRTAKELSITGIGNLKPRDKVEQLTKLQTNKQLVGMVGDGINDALVLSSADISIAVSNASDLSKQKSDIILLGGKLSKINNVFSVSKQLNTKIKQNIIWAVGYNSLVLPLACLNILSPYAAVFGMSLSSLIVVINSTRLLKK